jgi:hypothetical protein
MTTHSDENELRRHGPISLSRGDIRQLSRHHSSPTPSVSGATQTIASRTLQSSRTTRDCVRYLTCQSRKMWSLPYNSSLRPFPPSKCICASKQPIRTRFLGTRPVLRPVQGARGCPPRPGAFRTRLAPPRESLKGHSQKCTE